MQRSLTKTTMDMWLAQLLRRYACNVRCFRSIRQSVSSGPSGLNVPWAGVGVISAHGTREALDLLLKLHDEMNDWFRRDMITSAVESLSAKLDIPIVRDGHSLIVRGAVSEASV